MLALIKSNTNSKKRIIRTLGFVQLGLLTFANLWNIYEIISPGANTLLFNVLDLFWRFSNVFMLVLGIVVWWTSALAGWNKFAPLTAGLWLPVSIFLNLLVKDPELSSWFQVRAHGLPFRPLQTNQRGILLRHTPIGSVIFFNQFRDNRSRV